MSPLSLPVLAGAAIVTAPTMWRALVEGTAPVEVALSRYLVSVLLCWAALGLVAMLVGPPPRPEAATAEDEQVPEAAPLS